MPRTPSTRPLDAVAGLDGDPLIVSISDVHGYADAAASALLGVGETDRFDPVVEADADGTLHWAGNDYLLVVDGDLVDRGPANERAVEMVARLADEAPPGRVRYLLGNHEMALLLPAVLSWPRWYSGQVSPATRRWFYDRAADGLLAAAFDGYAYTYAHAGQPDGVDAGPTNALFRDAASRLRDAQGTDEFAALQRRLVDSYPRIFGTDGPTGRGPGAGLCWLDLTQMPRDAPPQVVGHTRCDRVTRRGSVVCENVIRNTLDSPGGEAALVETPETLYAVTRRPDGGVDVTEP